MDGDDVLHGIILLIALFIVFGIGCAVYAEWTDVDPDEVPELREEIMNNYFINDANRTYMGGWMNPGDRVEGNKAYGVDVQAKYLNKEGVGIIGSWYGDWEKVNGTWKPTSFEQTSAMTEGEYNEYMYD